MYLHFLLSCNANINEISFGHFGSITANHYASLANLHSLGFECSLDVLGDFNCQEGKRAWGLAHSV